MKDDSKKEWERNIAPELHETWLKMKRKKDASAIAEITKHSRPVIDRALNKGFVALPDLADSITKFFTDRINRERQQAEELNKLSK